MKIKDVKIFDVTQFIVSCDKQETAIDLFNEFIIFYDPLKIHHINKSALSISTEDGNIMFARDNGTLTYGRHTCIFLSPTEYNEFVMKYIEKRKQTISIMTRFQKMVYNFKLKRHARKCGSLNCININAYLLK